MIMNNKIAFGSVYPLALALGLSFAGFSLSPASVLHAQETCDVREYAEFVSYAQSLNPLSETLGRRLLQCGNRDYRESSFYWLSFYYSMTNHREKISGLTNLLPRETDTSPKVQAQRAALRGETKILSDRVLGGTQGYADDPWIVMSLARANMSIQEFKAAFVNYNKVLKLREDQDAAEIELLFAYIWAKDRDAAEGKLAALKRFDSSTYMKQSLERAGKLMVGEKPEHESQRDVLSLAYVQERDNRGYSAAGGRAVYKGLVEVEIEALEHTNPLEEEKENVAAVSVGKEWGHEGGFQVLTDIGYYSPGEDHVTGRLGLELPLGEAIHGGFGVIRKQVSAYERPPAGERAGIMRDTAYWDFYAHDQLSFLAALHREDDEAVFEDYKAEFKFGAALNQEMDSGFGLIIPVSYRHRPMTSPDYRSYPHDIRLGLGLRFGLSDGMKYAMHAEAVIESINRDDYGQLNSYEKLLGARMNTHIRYYFQKSYYNFFEGSAFVVEKMPGEKADERGSEFLIGIGVSQESH